MIGRRVLIGVGAACLAVLILIGAGRALDREARERDREVREWCAAAVMEIAGCPPR